MHIGLVVAENKPFNQFGHACVPGQEIPELVWKSWMEHDVATVNNRLQGGWVSWQPMPDPDDKAPPGAPSFDTMDKAALIEFAEKNLDVKLDKRTKLEDMRVQVKTIAERQVLINRAKAMTAAQALLGGAAGSAASGAESQDGTGEDRPPATGE